MRNTRSRDLLTRLTFDLPPEKSGAAAGQRSRGRVPGVRTCAGLAVGVSQSSKVTSGPTRSESGCKICTRVNLLPVYTLAGSRTANAVYTFAHPRSRAWPVSPPVSSGE